MPERKEHESVRKYEHLTDDELLHLGEEREQLTDDARLQFDAELSRRRLSADDIGSYRLSREEADKKDEFGRATPIYVHHSGVGQRLYGRANCRRDPSGLFEDYEATRWFVFFWLPIFPIGTYTVRRNLDHWLGFTWGGEEVAIERHPRNWEQILLTWVKAAAVLLSLRLLYLLVVHHPGWLKPG